MEKNHLDSQFHLLRLLAAWAYNPFPKLIKLKTSSCFSPCYSYWEATPCFSDGWNHLISIINAFIIFCANSWFLLTQFITLLLVHNIRPCILPSWDPVCFSEDITSHNPCHLLCYSGLFYPALQQIWLSFSQVTKQKLTKFRNVSTLLHFLYYQKYPNPNSSWGRAVE